MLGMPVHAWTHPRVQISNPQIAVPGFVFVKFANQNSPFVTTFVFRETTKFVFALEARHIFAYLKL